MRCLEYLIISLSMDFQLVSLLSEECGYSLLKTRGESPRGDKNLKNGMKMK